MPLVYLEFQDPKSSKFWQCERTGSKTVVTFGKIGTAGQKSEKQHGDDAKAAAFVEKLTAEKKKKGYAAKGGGSSSSSSSSKAPTMKAAAKAKAKAKAKAAPAPASKAPAMKKRKAEDDDAPAKGAPPMKKAKTDKGAAAASSSSSSQGKKASKSSSASKSSKTDTKAKPVDSEVPNRSKYQVYVDPSDGNAYAIKLLQTNIDGDSNNNKYYIIQMLTTGSSLHVWTRWGRVGEPGKSAMFDFAGSPSNANTRSQAMTAFTKKFKDKTSNDFDATFLNSATAGGFVKKAKKYQLLHTEDADGDGAGGDDGAPLGKLTEEQIQKGQGVLDELEGIVGKRNSKKAKSSGKKAEKEADEVAKLSSQFYSLIPTDTGRKKPPPIDSPDMVAEKQELLKFYLRMGFDDSATSTDSLSKNTPIDGVLTQALPQKLGDVNKKKIAPEYEISSCNDTAGSLLKAAKSVSWKNALLPSSVPISMYASVLLYTGNCIYRDLNEALRNEDTSRLLKYFPFLRLFLETFKKLPNKKRTVWRGMGMNVLKPPAAKGGKKGPPPAVYKAGSTITWWGVSSTTTEKGVAEGFACSCGSDSTLFKIECSSAIDISAMSFYSNEKECLLPPGTQLKVKKVTPGKKGMGAEVELQEVGQMVK